MSAFMTPAIAGIATYIAVAQYWINRRQYRLALFERRMVVFNSTMNMIVSVMMSSNPKLDECVNFMRETRDHELLFGDEVGAFINEVYKKATLLHVQIAVAPHTAKQQEETMNGFAEQMGNARRVFLKYLNFRKPSPQRKSRAPLFAFGV
jgi:hypothetical protein